MKKKTILFMSLLVLSSLLVGGLGRFLQHSLLEPLGIERSEHPVALPFVLLEDEILQAQVENGLDALQNPPSEPMVTEPPVTEPVTEPPTEPPTEAPTEPPTEPAGPVTDSWFDDALFIGESRIQGMQVFSRLGTADYFCAASMTIYGVLDAKLSDNTFTETTLEYLLSTRTYGKVFIHLGINEVPVGAEGIRKGILRIADRVRELQPDAVVVFLGCMSITETYANRYGFDMQTIHSLNELLRETAEEDPEHYRFVDTNSWAAGEDGYLRPELTGDGCHLYGEFYADWCNLIKEQAGLWDVP
jgi:hypothetical protein